MKYALTGVVIFLALFALPTFIPSQSARDFAIDQGFTSDDIARGETYAFERRLFTWSGIFVSMILLTMLAFRGRPLADWFQQKVRGYWLPTVLLMGLTCMLVEELVSLPLGLARLEHMRYWGLTERSIADWLGQHALSVLAFGGMQIFILAGFYLLLRFFPRTWWLFAWLGTTAVAIGFAYILPVAILPLFNTFTPLDQTKYRDLEPMVRQVLKKADVSVSNFLVVDASRQSGHSNAFFVGFGPTRRIVFYDNLLDKHTPDEIETVLAHELGHWKHNHIVQGIALGSAGCFAGFLLLYLFMRWLKERPPWRLHNAADPAGVPLLLLLFALGTWIIMPLECAVSRHFERQADAMSLELTGKTAAFIDTELKLSRDNISNVAPNPVAVFLFSTHPPAAARIQMARDWQHQNGHK